MMSARQRRQLRDLAQNQAEFPSEIQVMPPLYYVPGVSEQCIYIDTEVLLGPWFFAEITGHTGSTYVPYSWKERVETAAGTWADGEQSGTDNAYYAQPSTPLTTVVPNGTMVMMRPSPTVEDTFEFLLIPDAAIQTTNTLTPAATPMTTDVYESTPKLAFVGPYLVEKKGATDADPKTVESYGITTGNVGSASSGSVADELTQELRFVAPLAVIGNPKARTVYVPTNQTPVVTNVCPIFKWLHGTVTIAAIEYPIVFTLSDTDDGGLKIQVGDTVEKRTVNVVGTIGVKVCTTSPQDCCVDDPCADSDCNCIGITKVFAGTQSFTIPVPFISTTDGVSLYQVLVTWVFCDPGTGDAFTIGVRDLTDSGTLGATCANEADSQQVLKFLDNGGGCENPSGGSVLDDDFQPVCDPSINLGNTTVTTTPTFTPCTLRFVTWLFTWYSGSDSLTPILDFNLVIAPV